VAVSGAAGGQVLGVTALVVIVAVMAIVAGAEILGSRPGSHGRLDPVRTAAVAVAVGLAAGAPVAARSWGLVDGLVLLTVVGMYDAAAYLVGTGASSLWEGPAAGVATIGALTLGVAAIFDPPFRGADPWVLGGLAAMLAPFGPPASSWLLGDRQARVPVLRRLDSLILVGPAWLAVAAALR
jgi:hypothetical protein